VVNLNGVVANLGLTEFMVLVTGLRDPRRHLIYYADREVVNDRQDARRANCYTCGYLVGKREAANVKRLNSGRGLRERTRPLAVCRHQARRRPRCLRDLGPMPTGRAGPSRYLLHEGLLFDRPGSGATS
jgi:hypothetical protein